MSKVRILVGTRKGAFILTSNEKRDQWKVSEPYFAGWEIYHLKYRPLIQIGFMPRSQPVGLGS